jgi:hypothetical protein
LLGSVEKGRAVSQHGRVFAFSDENLSGMHPEGPAGHFASSSEIRHDRIDAGVDACDRVLSGDPPDDVAREQLAEGCRRPAGVESQLRLVQPAKGFDCDIPIDLLHLRSTGI